MLSSKTNIGHHMERKLRLRESKQLKKLDLIITATKVSIRQGQSAKSVFLAFRSAWSRPCTNPGQTIEPRSVFRTTTDPCRISSRWVDIWENGGRKKLLLTYNRERLCLSKRMRWLGHMDASWRAGVSAHGSSASEHRAAADGRSGESAEATVERERERDGRHDSQTVRWLIDCSTKYVVPSSSHCVNRIRAPKRESSVISHRDLILQKFRSAWKSAARFLSVSCWMVSRRKVTRPDLSIQRHVVWS